MISGGNVTIFVSDFERAVRFYEETLGLKLDYRAGEHWAQLSAGAGLTIGLHPPSRSAPPPGSSGAMQIGFSVDMPIEAAIETLEARGVSFHGPIQDDDAVRLAFFQDPDGNTLYLCEQKSA